MNRQHNMMNQKYHILVIGDGGVGKTSYIKNQIGQNVSRQYFPTEGIHTYHHENTVWYDFPGQEKYASHHINNKINLVIYMYDLSSKLSFHNLHFWEKYVQHHYGNIRSFRIANKSDLTHRIQNTDVKNTNFHSY